jgi:exonuclease-1
VFRGQRVAVDAHCWLYKGSVSCSREIVEGMQTTRFVDYFLDLIRLLQSEELIPVIVFDGRSLPAKEGTNLSRRELKQQNKAMAREAEADGRVEDAKTFYQRSLSGFS